MLKRKLATIGVAVGAIAVVAIPSAFAAGLTYHISAGTHKTGTATYVGKTPIGTASKPAINFTDVTTGVPLGCISGTASGVMKLGAAVPAAQAGTITKTTWNKCSGPGGLVLIPVQKTTWYVNGFKPTSLGKTKVFINNVVAKVSATTASACNFVVTGSTDGVYDNTTGKLTVSRVVGTGHVLKISKVVGCFGVLNNGDVVSFKAAYTIATQYGKLKIS